MKLLNFSLSVFHKTQFCRNWKKIWIFVLSGKQTNWSEGVFFIIPKKLNVIAFQWSFKCLFFQFLRIVLRGKQMNWSWKASIFGVIFKYHQWLSYFFDNFGCWNQVPCDKILILSHEKEKRRSSFKLWENECFPVNSFE